jgi:hypothetical protein
MLFVRKKYWHKDNINIESEKFNIQNKNFGSYSGAWSLAVSGNGCQLLLHDRSQTQEFGNPSCLAFDTISNYIESYCSVEWSSHLSSTKYLSLVSSHSNGYRTVFFKRTRPFSLVYNCFPLTQHCIQPTHIFYPRFDWLLLVLI